MAKKALLIGINDYFPRGAGGPDLRGCVNDVRDMAHTLNVLDIVPARVRTMRILTDRRATRERILEGVKWLVKGARKGDTLVFYYSGHGSQVLDVDGDEEPDHKDETICPHDFRSAGMIKDDDFRKAFGHVPPDANLDVFFDSCHAGSMTKEIPGINGISGEESVAYRYIEPPPDWGYLIESNPTIPVQGILKHGTATRKADKEAVESEQLNHVLWAACRDYQTSAETQIGGVWRGVFTYCYCRALRRAGLGIIRRRLDELVSVDIKGLGYNQVPQLEGSPKSLDQKVFT